MNPCICIGPGQGWKYISPLGPPKNYMPSASASCSLQGRSMAITILAPAPADLHQTVNDSDDDSDNGGVDLEGDSDMRPSKRARRSKDIVTPGETVTYDPQWMRSVFLPLDLCRHCLQRLKRARYIHRLFQHRDHRDRSRYSPKNKQASLGPTFTCTLYARNRRFGCRTNN